MSDIPEIDTVKAFFILLIGSALAAVIVYVYDTSLAPSLQRSLGR